MSGRIPIGRFVVLTGAITALGYGIMYITTPTDQQFYDSLAPDLKRKVDESRMMQSRLSAKEAQIKALTTAGGEEKIVWADSFDKKDGKRV